MSAAPFSSTKGSYGQSSEALVVGLARTGDRNAFEELVQRRQAWIRNLMRRLCGDAVLADDLAQQVFLQAWRDIPKLREPQKFAGWLKQLAVNTWKQYLRKNDPLRDAEGEDQAQHESLQATASNAGMAMDLDNALATLPGQTRLCIVLSYHEGMSHGEIAAVTDIPIGTVKSHIRRGTEKLKDLLSAYAQTSSGEAS